jgi:hypothetical protein
MNKPFNLYPKMMELYKDIEEHFRKCEHSEIDFITPETFGAVGDGIADDREAIQNAINFASENNLKLQLLNKTYYISDALSIPSFFNMRGNGFFNSTLLCGKSCLCLKDTQFVNLSGFQILLSEEKDNDYIGIEMTGNKNHMVVVDCLYIARFGKGIYSDSILWDCNFTNTRVAVCGVGLELVTNQVNLVNTFTNFYIDRCEKTMNIKGTESVFIGSNFSIYGDEAFIVSSNSNIQFIGCNFECDKHVDGTNIFITDGSSISFDTCAFVVNFSEATKFFCLHSGCKGVSVKNSRYKIANGNNMNALNFWNKDFFNCQYAGGVVFEGFNEIPQPIPYSHQSYLFKDLGINLLPVVNTVVKSSHILKGMQFIDASTGKICYYDGQKIRYVADDTELNITLT